MINLSPDAYDTAAPLVQDSRAELSVAATLGGITPASLGRRCRIASRRRHPYHRNHRHRRRRSLYTCVRR